MSAKVVMGLGNPGRRYERSRHNLGFLLIDRIADDSGVSVTKERCESLVGQREREWTPVAAEGRDPLVLAKPQTYMNHSGVAAAALVKRFGARGSDLVVAYDDLDLPFGRLRIRCGGSAGGHRGLASVLHHLADRDFVRVRMGIGRPPAGVDAVEYVLSRFSSEEWEGLQERDGVLSRAAEAVEAIASKGPVWAMENFNRVR